jgi:DNA-directed RNA polymerase subunit RPC12/RpoP
VTDASLFPGRDDPDCAHRSHYECVSCRKKVCARCGVELAEASLDWKTIGYWCPECLRREPE